jgi:hypothetical protein
VASLSAVLYHYWLVAPVLAYISANQWRVVAFAVAALIGCVAALLMLDALALACTSLVGLLLGGTWAGWHTRSDVHISLSTALKSHVESFWRDIVLLTIVVIVSRHYSTVLVKSRR